MEKLNSLKIITKNDCPYCVRAKALLSQNDISYQEIDRKNVEGFPYKTVPQIWLDGNYVGGYNELVEKLDGVAEPEYKECVACEG